MLGKEYNIVEKYLSEKKLDILGRWHGFLRNKYLFHLPRARISQQGLRAGQVN